MVWGEPELRPTQVDTRAYPLVHCTVPTLTDNIKSLVSVLKQELQEAHPFKLLSYEMQYL